MPADPSQPPTTAASSHAISLQAVLAGLLSGFVGFAGAFAIVLKGLTGAGATPAQAASGLLAVSVAMGLAGIYLSLKTRMPISAAWSTPGAAAAGEHRCGRGRLSRGRRRVPALRPADDRGRSLQALGRAITAIPPALANAMLAGVLLGLCLAPARAVAQFPHIALGLVRCGRSLRASTGCWPCRRPSSPCLR